ncbi:pyridoxal phosphate-dependent aminotransferase [Roseibacterium sp. SDUM158017]|uniref:pyridoxal phosphate-dependent aminotransferase n=1 Tax=Roseicyclus salinarum TaxID=3036773 RepID=UPI0024152E75|nr:pyridoxal phosphate-dependent aminotransferase [Roseibacterium sp. SDUM158017]MDG4650063.1 pyridoxal phosphate-dependent aminotransferase [Roseibacterium sp. SDUM158017]
MKYAEVLDRVADLGGAKWEVHFRARALAAAGRDIIELTIGEPDTPTPPHLAEIAIDAMRRGRTRYSNGSGEAGLRAALARRYGARSGRDIDPAQVLCFPGTQTALYAVMAGIVDAGSEVLVGDPMYATYEGIVRAAGGHVVPVPMDAGDGFRLKAEDVAARVTPATRAILLNSPHNPTGAILSRADIAAIGEVARAHDLWIVSDEVYEDLVFDGQGFASPLSLPGLADRVIVASSISKSHAAPGFRSGWIVAPAEFARRLLPLSETMLFGNQPFIADMTEAAVSAPSDVAAGMARRYAARAAHLKTTLEAAGRLAVHPPQAGMFAMVDISATGLASTPYALDLLEEAGVAVMPGSAFGSALDGWVRVSLTVDDARFDEAAARMAAHADTVCRVSS